MIKWDISSQYFNFFGSGSHVWWVGYTVLESKWNIELSKSVNDAGKIWIWMGRPSIDSKLSHYINIVYVKSLYWPCQMLSAGRATSPKHASEEAHNQDAHGRQCEWSLTLHEKSPCSVPLKIALVRVPEHDRMFKSMRTMRYCTSRVHYPGFGLRSSSKETACKKRSLSEWSLWHVQLANSWLSNSL